MPIWRSSDFCWAIHVGEVTLGLLQAGEHLLIGEVERLVGVLQRIHQPMGLGLEQVGHAAQDAHRAALLEPIGFMFTASIRLILSPSKDEASQGGGAASSFDKLRMRPNGAAGKPVTHKISSCSPDSTSCGSGMVEASSSPAMRDHRCADGEELDDVGLPVVAALVQVHADHALGAHL